MTYSTVEKVETGDSFYSLQDSEEGMNILADMDLHNLYTVNTRVIVVVLELQSVMAFSLFHRR